jgi:hypothetical protein
LERHNDVDWRWRAGSYTGESMLDGPETLPVTMRCNFEDYLMRLWLVNAES